MKYNLQFFADDDASIEVGTGEEVSATTAEQTETVNPNNESVESNETTESVADTNNEVENKRDFDRDAIYADARRRAEREAKQKQEQIDAEYVRRFGQFKNPITGQPIRSQADYLAALDAQEQAKLESEIKASGVDESLLQRLIDSNPAVRQAKEYMEKAQRDEAMRQIEADVAELSKLNSNIKTFDNVPMDVVEFAQNNKVSLTNAYKILNFGKMTEQNAEAVRQSAVNSIKGKQHLSPMNGVATNNSEVEIPTNEVATWKELFPNKTYEQLRTLYNNSL